MDNRNLFLAIAISVVILIGFDYLNPTPPQPASPTATVSSSPTPARSSAAGTTTSLTPGTAPGATIAAINTFQSIAKQISSQARISITSPSVTGSLTLKGARLDDLILNAYTKTIDKNSPKIRLLSPRGAENAYYAEYGWVAPTGVQVPGTDTLWTADRTVLSPQTPVTLRWDNGAGLLFKRTISLDKDFMFTVTQNVTNTSSKAVALHSYALVSRWGTPKTSGLYVLHEGPLGVFNNTLNEMKYKDLRNDGEMKFPSTGGWLGFTNKYWLTTLIPDQTAAVTARMLYSKAGNIEKYQADFVGAEMVVQPGANIETTSHLFAGAKKVSLLDGYSKSLGIVNFDLAIDFGILYFLTKPIFYAMHYIHSVVGNFGVSILLLTVSIKLLLFPLANKSYVSMSRMKKLQPKVKVLQERFKGDKPRLNQEMMALYKKEKANPAAGCLPILVQIPIFFSLYKVLMGTIEMRHAPFFGWIQDLSARDPASIWTLFGLIPWDHLAVIPSPLDIGAWPIIMGFTMWFQQRLNPAPTDPIQAKVFFYLPFIFTFMLARFSSGLVIYWAWNNTLSILQQMIIMRRMGVKIGK